MLNKYVPDMYQKNIFSIDYNLLKTSKIKCLLFDLDNTLTSPHSKNLDIKVKELINKLKKQGFIVIIFSNSFRKRVQIFEKILQVKSVAMAFKPLKYKYQKIMSEFNLKANEIVAVGDQLLTDIKGAKKNNIKAILVDPLGNDDFLITKINRLLEKRIFNNLYKKYGIEKGVYYE